MCVYVCGFVHQRGDYETVNGQDRHWLMQVILVLNVQLTYIQSPSLGRYWYCRACCELQDSLLCTYISPASPLWPTLLLNPGLLDSMWFTFYLTWDSVLVVTCICDLRPWSPWPHGLNMLSRHLIPSHLGVVIIYVWRRAVQIRKSCTLKICPLGNHALHIFVASGWPSNVYALKFCTRSKGLH